MKRQVLSELERTKRSSSEDIEILKQAYKFLMQYATDGYVKHGRGAVVLLEGDEARAYASIPDLEMVIGKSLVLPDKYQFWQQVMAQVLTYNPDSECVVVSAATEQQDAKVFTVVLN